MMVHIILNMQHVIFRKHTYFIRRSYTYNDEMQFVCILTSHINEGKVNIVMNVRT